MKILLYELGMLGHLWLLLAIALVLPVVLASLFMCVPKWLEGHPLPDWAEGRVHSFEVHATRILDAVFGLGIFKPVAYVGKLVAAATLGLLVMPFALTILYIQACVSVIEGACPYTHDSTWHGYVRSQWAFLTTAFEPSKWSEEFEAAERERRAELHAAIYGLEEEAK